MGLEVPFFDVLEILVCAMFQLVCCGFVANDDGMGMQLEGTYCPFLTDCTLDGVLKGASLVVAVCHDEHFLSIHHGSDSDCQSRLGHLIDVVIEEATVGDDGVRGEALYASAALQRAEGLVECDVSVRTDAAASY